jgi:hypothetical protein
MDKPVPDKAKLELDFPEKCYIGAFGRSAQFDAHLDQTGISLTLHHTGNVRKAARMHFHYGLFAGILRSLANTVSSMPPHDEAHREALQLAAEALSDALRARVDSPPRNAGQLGDREDLSKLTPEDEVLLLHVLE